MQILAKSLFIAILETLEGGKDCEEFLPSTVFPGDEETSVCRLNFYPKCPDPGMHLGVGPHSDPAIVTVLLQDEDVSSLQVERDGKFYDIPPIKGWLSK
jgi:isopenicillin N synthase-like dioxygenase